MPVSTFVRGSGSGAAPAVDDSLFAAVKLALRIDGDEADALLSGNIAAAMELAERQAPTAPDTVKREAIIRATAYFFEGAVPDGSQPAAIWRISGAAALLAPWTVRRAGVIA